VKAIAPLAVGIFGLVTAIFAISAPDLDQTIRSDAQLRAMRDELARSKTLQLNSLDKPYFIQYTIGDSDQLYVNASLGGLIASERAHLRSPRITVRVGSQDFDNTNSVYSGTARLGLLPTDDSYSVMRTDFWLATDSLYKIAVDQITRKRNALREIGDVDKTPDLAPVKPVTVLQSAGTLQIDQKGWEDLLREISNRFAAHPNVIGSNVQLRAIYSMYRLMNTEGTVVRIPQELSELAIRGTAVAPDGSRVWNHRFMTVLTAPELPRKTEIAKAADEVASETEALAKAPLGDDYSGPILFEQEAAAELMAQTLTDAIRLQRKPIAPPGNAPQILESVWSSRLGSKVTPDWLSISDDPSQEKVDGTVLAGHYDVDDEGVPAQKVVLVDKGMLKGFLFSREPVGSFRSSNGHGRLPGAFGAEEPAIGNLFVHADQAISEAQLKAKLVGMVKTAGLKYGMIIRRIDFPATANYEELQSFARQIQKSGYARTLSPPLLAYRIYPDGREELVRGLRFREFSAKDLRDIDAAADHPYVLNYVNNGTSLDLAGSGADATSSAVVCPSLLFDSVDLVRAENDTGKQPVVPAPPLVQ
jgi:hypothetical protein